MRACACASPKSYKFGENADVSDVMCLQCKIDSMYAYGNQGPSIRTYGAMEIRVPAYVHVRIWKSGLRQNH